MKKHLLLFGLALVTTLAGNAQEGYRISGRSGVQSDGRVLLIRDDGSKQDTMNSTSLQNGVFMLEGRVDGPVAVSLVMGEGQVRIPVILENVPFMVNVRENNVLVQGGGQQELLSRYTRLNQAFLTEQSKVASEASQQGADVAALQERVNRAYEAYVNATLELIKANPDAYATAYVVSQGITAETEKSLRSKYELLGDVARATIPGKRIAAALERHARLSVGEEAPNFTTSQPDGNTFSLHDLPAKWKLLHFWSPDDIASRQMNPELVKLYLQYRPKGLQIVSISVGADRAKWKNSVGLDGLVWTNGQDSGEGESSIARSFMVGSLPCFFLLDGENRIVVKDITFEELSKKLAELTRKKKK